MAMSSIQVHEAALKLVRQFKAHRANRRRMPLAEAEAIEDLIASIQEMETGPAPRPEHIEERAIMFGVVIDLQELITFLRLCEHHGWRDPVIMTQAGHAGNGYILVPRDGPERDSYVAVLTAVAKAGSEAER